MKIALIVAMEKEFLQMQTILDDRTEEVKEGNTYVKGRLHNNEIIMCQSGIGKVNAAMRAAQVVHHYHPDLVVSSGVAGGADVNMNVMDVVVSSECTYHDVYCGKECERGQLLGQPARFKSPDELVEKALHLKHNNGQIHAGLVVTGDWFVDDKAKMQSILDLFPDAKAVDMESCAIAQVCYFNHVPFVSFRIISDIPLKDTDASQYFDFWDRLAEGSFQIVKEFIE